MKEKDESIYSLDEENSKIIKEVNLIIMKEWSIKKSIEYQGKRNLWTAE